MSMEISHNMACIALAMRDKLPLDTKLVEKVLNEGNCSSATRAVLELLCLHLKDHQSDKDNLLKKTAVVLEIICVVLESSKPLKYLMQRDFQSFDRHCAEAKSQNHTELLMKSHGLYPPNDPKDSNSIFSRHSQGAEEYEGNPHWILARYGLSQWFTLNKQKLPKNIEQAYAFLLSHEQMVEREVGLKRMWALLYCFYTEEILENNIDKEYAHKWYITWRRGDFHFYRNELLALQNTLHGQEKLMYLLVLGLLPIFDLQRRDRSLFTLAYNSFKIQHGRISDWDMLVYVLFLQIGERNGEEEVVLQIIERVRRDFQRGDLNCSEMFVSIFFNFEELLPFIIAKKIDYKKLMLRDVEKRQLLESLLQQNQLPGDMIKYLQNEHFKAFFGGQCWGSMDFVDCILPVMATQKELFMQKLAQLSECQHQKILDQQFELFFSAWESVYQIDRSEVPTLEMLTQSLQIKRQDFRENFRFLTNPRDFPNIVFKILMGYVRFFDSNKQTMKNGGPLLQLFKKIQDKELSELMEGLDENQRNTFWKEWSELLRYDPEFIEDILHPCGQNIIDE